MTTTPPDKNRSGPPAPENGPDPADLSELTATDALLNRLGNRQVADGDLHDPAAKVLAELLAEIDETRVPDVGAARLIEVLAGRPLYIAGAEAATEPWLPDVVASGSREDTDDLVGSDHRDSRDAAGQRVIDLTDDLEQDGQVAASVAAPSTVPIARPPVPDVVPIGSAASARARRWDGAMGHVLLPAACVLALLAVGGGVSAAVTGNPMAPVDGISRVMAQLPGVKDDSVDQVQGEIKAARRAVITKNNEAATLHLDRAKANLEDVSGSDKTDLKNEISEVEGLVPGATPDSTSPTPGAEATSAPSDPEPSETPEPTVSPTPDVTTEPDPDPGPSSDPDVPQNDPTTAPVEVQSTPDSEAASS